LSEVTLTALNGGCFFPKKISLFRFRLIGISFQALERLFKRADRGVVAKPHERNDEEH
jgi:hypothetical protein